MKFNFYRKADLGEAKKQSNEEKVTNMFEPQTINQEKYDEIDKMLNYKYLYEKSIEVPSKTTVTALKEEANLNEEDQLLEENILGEKIKYNGLKEFKLEETEEITGAKRGTLIHMVLQQISQDANKKEITDYIEMTNTSEKEKEFLYNQKYIFDKYMESELYKELEKAKEIHTENPFFMKIPYKDTEDEVLVQGVIDLFFIDEDDRVVLVDYKTDRVEN
jgi:ATP-dependent helicase/nuclease subunit A